MAVEVFENVSIQPLAMQHDGQAGFLRTADGQLLLDAQPFNQPIMIVDFQDIQEELTPTGKIERALGTLRGI